MGMLEHGSTSEGGEQQPNLRLVSERQQEVGRLSRDRSSNSNPTNTSALGLANINFQPQPIRSNDQAPVLATRLRARVSSLTRYDERTLSLLANYFAGTISKGECAELAGNLVFPHAESASKLFSERVRIRKLSEQKEQRLLAEALYPDNQEAATIAVQKLRGKRTLSLEQQVALYSADAYPESKREATKLSRALLQTLRESRELPEQSRAERIREFARDQIVSPVSTVSTTTELAALFDVSDRFVEESLSAPEGGLSPEEHRYRKEKQILTSNKHRDALGLCILKAARNLISLENELFKSGVIDKLSTREEIRTLFGISRAEIETHVRFIYTEDLRFREKVFGRHDFQKLKIELSDEVERELEQLRAQKKETLSSDEDLATRYRIEPATVFHILQERLPPLLLQYRALKLREGAGPGAYLTSPVKFALSELTAFRKGEIEQVSSDQKLGELFSVSPELIYDQLSPVSPDGLSSKNFKDREFSLALQERQDAPSVALRMTMTEYLKEQVVRAKNKTGEQPTSSSLASASKRRVQYQGHEFDSVEEAAHALLLEKFIPGFRLTPNETLHLRLDNRTVDFYIPNEHAVIEYHPIKTYWNRFGEGAFRSRQEYQEYIENVKELKKISSRLAQWYKEAVKNQLYEEYCQERKQVIEKGFAEPRPTLIVTTSLEEHYHRVIRPFGKNVPGFEAFKKEFNRLRAHIKSKQYQREQKDD